MHRQLIFVLTVLLGPAMLASAAERDVTSPSRPVLRVGDGSRVRVTVADGVLKGSVFAGDAEAFTLLLERGGSATIRRDSVERLEVSTGKRGNALKGLLIGAALYTTIGAVEGEKLLSSYSENPSCDSSGCRIKNACAMGVAGGALGALIGSLIKSERWVRVDGDPHVVVTRLPRGVGAQITVAW